MIKKLTTVLLFFLLIEGVAHAQTTEGTEFWATFMNNYDQPAGSSGLTHSLIASSRQDATVTVSNPQTGWSQNFTVKAGSIATFTVPHAQGYTYSAGTTEKHGLKITSTKPISLYASNFYEYTYDATIVLPIGGLGKDYIVQIFENELYAKEFAVVATANLTQVTITPHARTTDGHVKNVPYTVTLNAGETYQVMSSDGGSDFSGTRIQTNKPVAVFSGHQCINTPTGNPWCDHIVEQQTPVNMWGKQFALTKTYGQSGDRVMLTAKDDNTKVTLNGSVVATLGALESYSFRLTANSAFVETSGPAACYIYLEGARDNRMMGDPASIHISPVEQRVSEITFATFQTAVSRTHYVNVITTAKGAAAMMLDGKSVASAFSTLAGNSNLRFAKINIPHGTHTLRTSTDGFTGHVYGLGDCESYAYTFGSATIPLDGDIVVNGEPRIDILYDDRLCYKEPVSFSVQTNVAFTSVLWKFGDGQTSTEKTVQHTYTSPGTYRVMMVLTGEDGRDTAYTNVIVLETLRDTIDVAICEGETYKIGSQTLSKAGTHNVTLQSRGGCDSIVTVRLSVGNTYLTEETASFRRGGSYRWHWKWYKEAGVYRDTLLTVNGCDSIFQLTLTAVDPTETMYDTICYQSAYEWQGHTFTLPSIEGYEDQQYINYTLDYFDQENCIIYRMNLAIVPSAGGEKEIYETIKQGTTYDFYGDQLSKSGIYQKTVSTGYGCSQDITLHLNVASYPIYETSHQLCHEDSYTWRGQTYTEAGTYADTVWSATGIDTLYRLTLTDSRRITETSVQATGSYSWQGSTYTQSGTYTKTLTAANGCDSIVTLHLGIGEKCKVTAEESRDLCDGESILWNGQTCYAGNTYTATLTTKGGCDSVVTLTLNPMPKKTTTLTATICEGDFYKVGDTRLSEKGTHTVTLTAANGCDSVITVTINVAEPFEDVTNQTIIAGGNFKWQGDTYSEQGTYRKGYVSKLTGCDSIYTLNLTVKDKPVLTRSEQAELCKGDSYSFYGQTLRPTASRTYTHTAKGNEADTVVTITLTVHPTYTLTDAQSICEGERYTWQGTTYMASTVETKTLTTVHGCDSVVTLRLTVHPAYTITDEPVTRCYGETFTWNGTVYDRSGTYTQRLQSIHGCDSVVTRTVTILPLSESLETQVIYKGQSYRWNGKVYDETGNYEYHTTNQYGCDSTAYLYLTVSDKPVEPRPVEVTLCQNEPYQFYDEVIDTKTAGVKIYTHRITGIEADTLVTLTLNVLPVSRVALPAVTICQGDYHTWNGTTYDSKGTYTQTFTAANGCDSVVTQVIRVAPVYTDIEDIRHIYTGESLTWQGDTYTESTTVTKTLTTIHGCDSIVTLRLTVSDKPVEQRTVNATICQGETYWFYGTAYTTQTNTSVLRTGTDADTLVTLYLDILPVYSGIEETIYICEGSSHSWNGQIYTLAGDYTRTLQTISGCDSTVTLHLKTHPTYSGQMLYDTLTAGQTYSWEGQTYTEAGDYDHTYSTIHGCDSVVTLRLYGNYVTVSEAQASAECAGDGVLGIDLSLEGVVHQVVLTFDEAGHQAGLRDTMMILNGTHIDLPYHARAGRFNCTLQLLFRGQIVLTHSLTLTLLYPSSVLEQAWNDVVAVLTHNYNGGYDFTAFQWYENGQPLPGETGAYLYRPLQMGAEYSALLTDTTGMQLMTCPLQATYQGDITLYPTVSNQRQQIVCRVPGEAEMTLYDATGKQLYTIRLQHGDNTLTAPPNSGLYMANIVLKNSEKQTIKKLLVR